MHTQPKAVQRLYGTNLPIFQTHFHQVVPRLDVGPRQRVRPAAAVRSPRVQFVEHRPQMSGPLREGRADQSSGFTFQGLCDLKQMRATSDAFLVRLGQAKLVLRESDQALLGLSKKLAVRPSARLS